MKVVIEETLEIARAHFRGFGFSADQIEPLLEAGKRDLERELSTLDALKQEIPLPLEKIDHTLHALKGLLLNMGNHETADEIHDLRSKKRFDSSESIQMIEALLGE